MISPRVPLRVGLLIDSFIQPQWVYKVITDIKLSSVSQVVLIIKSNDIDVKQRKLTSKITKILKNTKYILYLTYTVFDDFLSKVNPNAFSSMSIEKLIADCPIVHVEPLRKGHFDSFQEKDITTIREYNLDVALHFGFQRMRGDIVQIAKFGVWSFGDEGDLVGHTVPLGFWEVMEGKPVTESTLRVLGDLGNGKVIYRSYTATNRFSVKMNRNNIYLKSSLFILRKLTDIYNYGVMVLDNDSTSSSDNICNNRPHKKPTNFKILLKILKIFGKNYHYKIQLLIYCYQWFLAYKIENKEAYIGHTPYKFENIVPPQGYFWADPFPIKREDKYFIFIEEYIYKMKKGHISVLEMDKDGKYESPMKVLEKEYHLSYPFIFEWHGDYYMIPETAQARSIELYRCASFPLDWKLEKILMSDIKAVDTTLAEINGLWWMFVSIGIDGTSNHDELHLFYANTPLGPWKPHKRNPVKSDVRSARSAGRIFLWQGEFYRPSQDCSEGYGHAVSINKIIRIDHDSYIEAEVSKILPQWSRHAVATHTLNSCDDLTMIDGMMMKFKFTIPGLLRRNNTH